MYDVDSENESEKRALTYEIKERILKEYPYKTELHAHTHPISPCSEFSPDALIETYLKTGVDAIALTNHFTPAQMAEREPREFAKAYIRAFYDFRDAAEARGIKAIFGAEIRFAENSNDYLLYGIDEDDVLPICAYLPFGLERFRREFYREGMLLIQAHPCRNGMTDIPLSLLDGIEAFNLHPGHNSRIAIAARRASEGGLLVTGGTDFHHPGHEGCCLMRSRELPTDSHELSALLRSRDFALEVSGSVILP